MSNEEFEKKVNLLPKKIVDMIYSLELVDFIIEMRGKFDLTQDQINKMNDIILSVFFKDTRIEKFTEFLILDALIPEDAAKEIGFTLMSSILYEAKDFFPGIEDEIIRLGGEIPKNSTVSLSQQFAKREEEIEKIREKEERIMRDEYLRSTIYEKIDNLMKDFPNVGEQTIGSQESIQVADMPVPMKPMIRYWIKDYRFKNGNNGGLNLDRVQYVCHDKNTRNMNSEERSQLIMVLKSADGEIDLPYSGKLKKIDFSLIKED